MFYVIAIVDTVNARVFNTDDGKYKDLPVSTVKMLLERGAEFKNVVPSSGTALKLLGNVDKYPRIVTCENGTKALASIAVPTILKISDQGMVTLVGVDGTIYSKYTRELCGMEFTNGGIHADGTWYGHFEEVKYVDATAETVEAFGMFMFGDMEQELGFKTSSTGAYTYAGDKKAKQIKVPEGFTDISTGAFNGVNTVELVLPKTIKEIAPGAFKGALVQKLVINGGSLSELCANALQGAVIGELYLVGQIPLNNRSFYGARIRKIFANGKTYSECLRYKIEATTSVKVLR